MLYWLKNHIEWVLSFVGFGTILAIIQWISGAVFKFPKFIQLLYYLKKPTTERERVIGKIIQILEFIGVPEEIAKPLKRGPKPFDRSKHTREHGVYFLIKPLHDNDFGPFCPKCADNNFEIHLNRTNRYWSCFTCGLGMPPLGIDSCIAARNYDLSVTKK